MQPLNTSRRRFLAVAAVGCAATYPVVRSLAGYLADDDSARWSDSKTWGGKAPSDDQVAVISRSVVLDKDARVAGMVVEPGGKLIFDRDKNVKLTSKGNVIVRGHLKMRPRGSGIKHTLAFEGVNEQGYKGGGLDPLDSDVGLWVMGKGRLTIVGTKKKDWTRVVGSVAAGTTSISLRKTPVGWRRGDEIAVAPTGGAADSDHFDQFDVAQVEGISGNNVTLSTPTQFAHPEVEGSTQTFTAEALNLTRNVVIQGTAGGRAHIFIRSDKPQTIKNCTLRYMGPRKNGEKILGRWPLHFHHSHDGSRTSLVEGVVVRDAGSHAFVPHISHGVTFRDCIAFDVLENAFWWDEEISDATDDILWDHCVAARVKVEDSGKFRLAGFSLRSGKRNEVRDCVAVGVQGIDSSCGFNWLSPQTGVWTFRDCLSHNNKAYGAFYWKNGEVADAIDGFITYRNGIGGVLHGAYANNFVYENTELIDDTFDLHARSKMGKDGVLLTLSQGTVKNAPVGLLISGAIQPGTGPARIEDWVFEACGKPVEVVHDPPNPGDYEFIRCTVDGRPLAKSDFTLTKVSAGSTIKVDGEQIYP